MFKKHDSRFISILMALVMMLSLCLTALINVCSASTTGIVMEHFSDESQDASSFTNSGFQFNLTGGHFKVENVSTYGWTGTETDDWYVDNYSSLISEAGIVGSIEIVSGTFMAHSIYVFPGNDGDFVSNEGTVIVRGKLGGTTKFTKTISESDIILNINPYNGFTFVDLSDYNTIEIDALEFELTGNLRYLAIDAFKHESTAPASSDATLKASSTIKGQTVSGLGTPNSTLGSETAGAVTITAAKAADTSNTGSFITLFDKNDTNATVKAVKYAFGASTANFEADAAYANEAITDGDFFIIKVTAEDATTVNFYKIIITVTSAPPTATVQAITGTLQAGEMLTGHYTYSDVNGDLEGTSTFKWYRSDNASGLNKTEIVGATSITYVLQSEDIGKYISFEITPVAQTGILQGTAVESEKVGAILADTTAPTGYSVTIDQIVINNDNKTAMSFTFSGAEVGVTYNYVVSSSGGGSVSGSGIVATATQQIIGINTSTLADGMLTLNVTLTDGAGNIGTIATDTIRKDDTAPTGYGVTIDQVVINNNNKTAMTFTFSGAEVGVTYNYVVSSSGGGSVSSSGIVATATEQITGINTSTLADGTLTLSVTLTDTVGNTGTAATDTAVKDATAPLAYSVAIDQIVINNANKTAMSFTFSVAEVGSTYNYVVSSSGGGSVSGSGTVAVASQQITGINTTSLSDGMLTLSVTLTDTAENTGTAATDTVSKDATAPSGYSVTIDQADINNVNQTAMSFTFSGAEVGSTYNYTISSSGGIGTVTGSGTIAVASQQISGIDATSLPDYTLTLMVTLTDTVGNVGSPATDTVLKNAIVEAAPTATVQTITGILKVGGTLTGHYTYSDVNGDIEGTSTYKWYRSDNASGLNKTAIPGKTAITYVLQSADEGKYIGFEVTPIAATGIAQGTAVSSTWAGAVLPAEAAPTATVQTITGILKVGGTLTGHYTYSDVNGDIEGTSTYKWYRADDASGLNKTEIAGATSVTYVVQAADTGKYISFEVTPVAATGTAQGTAVESEKSGPVTTSSSGGSGGGGGGSSSTTTNQSSQSTIVVVNGKEQNVGKETQKTEDDKSTVIVELNNKAIESKIDEAIKMNTTGTGNVIQVSISDTKSEVAKVELTGDVVSKLEENTFDVSVKRDNVEYIIPAGEFTISKVAEKLGILENDLDKIMVEVKITKLDENFVEKYKEVANINGAELVFPPVSFEVVAKTLKADGTTGEVEINKFSNYVERVMEIPTGIDPSKITTGIVFNSDGTYSHVPTDVFKKDGKWYARLSSLTNSNYSVIWNPITVKSVENHWAKDTVNDLASRLVIFNADTFEPNKAITRADFAEYIVRALGIYREGSTLENNFKDVNTTGSRTLAILIANEYGIVSGYEDGTFRGDNQITREEAMVMYQRAMKLTKLTGTDKERYLTYTDYSKVSEWATFYVEDVLAAHVFNGTTATTISPKENLTYAEATQAIKNLLVESKLIN